MANVQKQSGWTGWVYFAGLLMLVMFFFQALFGLVALFQPDFYTVVNEQLLVFDMNTWGWIHLAWAVVLLTAGISLMKGGGWGRVFASIMAVITIAVNFVFLPVYPLWSLLVIAIAVVVLYAIIVHGNEAKEA